MKLTCIIPAYNEASRINMVLDAVCHHPLIDEIIVVDDHSTDETAAAAIRADVRVIRLEQNRGKSFAVAEGISVSTGTHLLFLDADLNGLQPEDISALIEPVRQQQADASISLRSNSPLLWRLIGLDYISGERLFSRHLVEGRLEELKTLAHFGLEVWLNNLWIIHHTRIAVVHWPKVISPFKTTKRGVIRGVCADILMIKDILCTISLSKVCYQIRTLRSRRVCL